MSLNFITQKLNVNGDVSEELVINRVQELGYEVEDLASEIEVDSSRTKLQVILSVYVVAERDSLQL